MKALTARMVKAVKPNSTIILLMVKQVKLEQVGRAYQEKLTRRKQIAIAVLF